MAKSTTNTQATAAGNAAPASTQPAKSAGLVAGAASQPIITLQLYDAATLQALDWNTVSSVAVTVKNATDPSQKAYEHTCGPSQAAGGARGGQEAQGSSGAQAPAPQPVQIHLHPDQLPIGTGEALLTMEGVVTYGSEAEAGAATATVGPISFLASATSLCSFDVVAVRAAQTEPIAIYTIDPRWCQKAGVTPATPPKITKAWAQPTLVTGQNGPTAGARSTLHATEFDGTFTLALPTQTTYDLHVETEGVRSRMAASSFHACCEGAHTLPVCLVPCERTETLLIVDDCNNAVTDIAGLTLDGFPLTAGSDGIWKMEPVKPGTRILRSANYDLHPSRLEVDESEAQVHVVKAVRKVPAVQMLQAGAVSDESHYILRELPPGSTVKVIGPNGEDYGELQPDANRTCVFPVQGYPVLTFQVLTNGRVRDAVTLTA